MLQISGLNYTWDKDTPIGQRIVEITDAKGNQLNPEQIYSVAVNNFVATGGDGFTVFKERQLNLSLDLQIWMPWLSISKTIKEPFLHQNNWIESVR